MDATQNRSCCGMLPQWAPLAVPYVPFQQKDPVKYEARRGLIRGTLFPCLDYPFLDMENTEEKDETPLHTLQALGFALQELGLYLDTHSDDEEAAALYADYAKAYQSGMETYRDSFGALRQLHSVRDGRYTWISEPWPWELAANQEE